VSTAGTSNVKWLIKENQRRKLDLKIVLAKDHADAFLMVKHGRAAAFFMDEVLLAGFVANAHHPEEWVISQEAYMAQPYAIGLPKGSPKFKAVVDSAVIAMMEDGTIEKLYNQWFNAPIPPREVNLQLPMHKVLKKVLAYPTDSGDPLHYQ
jgi:glutamate/aspartate transport system substrate-binding protein